MDRKRVVDTTRRWREAERWVVDWSVGFEFASSEVMAMKAVPGNVLVRMRMVELCLKRSQSFTTEHGGVL